MFDFISKLTPFLAPYPSWVKILFSTWVILTAVFLIALVVSKPSSQTDANNDGNTNSSSNTLGQGAEGQRIWLIIEGVDLYGGGKGRVKVTANVNGTKFVYPTLEGIEWIEVGPSMASQKFLLPVAEQYEISFSMKVQQGHQIKVLEDDPIKDLVSVDTVNVSRDKAKSFKSQYNVYPIEGMIRGSNVMASIRFKLSQNAN
jgi:hypothetical protein